MKKEENGLETEYWYVCKVVKTHTWDFEEKYQNRGTGQKYLKCKLRKFP